MADLKISDKIHGFVVKRKTALPDVFATMYEMEHESLGSKLIYLDRDDENKTFSVGFKTIPTDSTGVFHIIEHSVLCGSEKFPVKEPFVELLKSSLQTFLNAMTFPDKTVYPVSSRNAKDFLNLADVYLDAVFNPIMKKKKNVFLQEGWHKEIEDGKLSYNGVVFNEMKGAYSSPEEYGESRVSSMLYGESCYGYDSGGNPDVIPSLSYENFLASHAKFYHPSNAYFFLDGSVDLEETLALIESYISGYERRELDVDADELWRGEEMRDECEYEISSGESESGKSRLLISYITTRYDETLESLALDILIDAISSGNKSPVKKAILESGLAEDISIYTSGSKKLNSLSVEFRNVKDGALADVEELFFKTLREIRTSGINKEYLEAAMNHLEFVLRERDMGGLPVGVAFNISVFDTWLYGGDPAASLSYSENFKKLRELLSTDYFEKLIEKYFLDNKKRAVLTLRPSASLGEKRRGEAEERYRKEMSSLTDSERAEIIKEREELVSWQSSEDSLEALSTLPSLEISDIPERSERTPTELYEKDGVGVISHGMKTGGITYTELFFDISDISESEAPLLPLFTSLINNVGTDEYDAYSFKSLIKRELGSFTVAPVAYLREGEVRVYVKLGVSMLDSKRSEFLDILKKFACDTRLDDAAALSDIIKQKKMGLEEAFASSGNAFGFIRSLASRSPFYAMRDRLMGYDFYTKIKEFEKNPDSAKALVEKIAALRDKVFSKERLTLSLAGSCDEGFAGEIISLFAKKGDTPPASTLGTLGKENEGIAIPAQVGFAAMSSRLSDVGAVTTGALAVAKTILNFEYLWCEVRVKGGAYGVSFRVTKDGAVGYTSYRDPSPVASLGVFSASSRFLREFLSSERNLTRYIIGAMGEYEPYNSIPAKASLSTSDVLSGSTEEEKERVRREILATDKESLLGVADMLEKLENTLSPVIVAPKEMLSSLETVLYL